MSTKSIVREELDTSSIGVFPISAKDDKQKFKFDGYCLSEQNIARVIKLTSDVDHTSFVISYHYYDRNEANHKHLVTFVMLGYYFECYIPDDVAAWNNVYASVTLSDNNGELVITPYISDVDGKTYVVVLSPEDNSNDTVSGCLHLLTKDNYDNCVIPTSSLERHNFKSIDTDDTFLICGNASVFSST